MKSIILKQHEVKRLDQHGEVLAWRAIKPQPEFCGGVGEKGDISKWGWHVSGEGFIPVLDCPKYPLNSVLFVKETWAKTTNINHCPAGEWPDRPHIAGEADEGGMLFDAVIYRADGGWEWCSGNGGITEQSHWRSAVHMPKEFSRFNVEIAGIRVMRPQDVTELDAWNSGVTSTPCARCDERGVSEGELCEDCGGEGWNKSRLNFRRLLESLHGPGIWEKNLYHFVYHVKKV